MPANRKPDPLENEILAKVVAGTTFVVMVVAYYFSAQQADARKLPAVALDSPFLFDLERAVLVAALFAASLIFLVRGWHGYYPSKVSTTGAEYPDREAVEMVTKGSDATATAVEELRTGQLEIAKAARDDFDLLKRELRSLEQRLEGDQDG